MSTSSKTRNKEARKSKKRAARAAKKAMYQGFAAAGLTKKTRRAGIRQRKGKKLAKDFKNTSVAAALARAPLGKPEGWVNRKADRLLGKVS